MHSLQPRHQLLKQLVQVGYTCLVVHKGQQLVRVEHTCPVVHKGQQQGQVEHTCLVVVEHICRFEFVQQGRPLHIVG